MKTKNIQSIRKISVNYILSGLCGKEEMALKGIREFTSDKEAEKFCERLANLKLALAFRNIKETFTKKSDCYKKARYQTLHTPSNYSKSLEFTDKGWNAARNNPYKLSVSISSQISSQL